MYCAGSETDSAPDNQSVLRFATSVARRVCSVAIRMVRPAAEAASPFVALRSSGDHRASVSIVARLSHISKSRLAVGVTKPPSVVSTVAAACSDPGCDELVAVELGEVVGCHQQPPFGPDRDPASSVESVDQSVVFGVREHGLDHLDPLAVELLAVL